MIYSIPVLVIFTIITFVLARGAVRIISKERESAERTKILEEKAAALVVREQELREGIESLKTEEGIKKEIKERFSVTQENEHVAVIVDDRNGAVLDDDSGSAWYKRLWAVIIGR